MNADQNKKKKKTISKEFLKSRKFAPRMAKLRLLIWHRSFAQHKNGRALAFNDGK